MVRQQQIHCGDVAPQRCYVQRRLEVGAGLRAARVASAATIYAQSCRVLQLLTAEPCGSSGSVCITLQFYTCPTPWWHSTNQHLRDVCACGQKCSSDGRMAVEAGAEQRGAAAPIARNH